MIPCHSTDSIASMKHSDTFSSGVHDLVTCEGVGLVIEPGLGGFVADETIDSIHSAMSEKHLPKPFIPKVTRFGHRCRDGNRSAMAVGHDPESRNPLRVTPLIRAPYFSSITSACIRRTSLC